MLIGFTASHFENWKPVSCFEFLHTCLIMRRRLAVKVAIRACQPFRRYQMFFSCPTRNRRKAFTLIELPGRDRDHRGPDRPAVLAVRAAREAAAHAMHEQSEADRPSECTISSRPTALSPRGGSSCSRGPTTCFTRRKIISHPYGDLAFMEQTSGFNSYNIDLRYNLPDNQTAASFSLNVYLCPSNAIQDTATTARTCRDTALTTTPLSHTPTSA